MKDKTLQRNPAATNRTDYPPPVRFNRSISQALVCSLRAASLHWFGNG